MCQWHNVLLVLPQPGCGRGGIIRKARGKGNQKFSQLMSLAVNGLRLTPDSELPEPTAK
jgi:hypothetical protein